MVGLLHTELHSDEELDAMQQATTALVFTAPTPLNILTHLAGTFVFQQRRARSGKWSFQREHFRYAADGAVDFVPDDAVERIAFDTNVDTSLDLSTAKEQITHPTATHQNLAHEIATEKNPTDAMRTLTTFNLGLELRPEEREAKNAVVLPFQKTSQGSPSVTVLPLLTATPGSAEGDGMGQSLIFLDEDDEALDDFDADADDDVDL